MHKIAVSLPRLRGCIRHCFEHEVAMTDREYSRKLEELEVLLNDPTVPMQPDRIWSLLADVSKFKVCGTQAQPALSIGATS